MLMGNWMMHFNIRRIFPELVVAAFYLVTFLLTLLLYLSGTHEFFYLAEPLNGLIIAWVALSPISLFLAWRKKRYLPLVLVGIVVFGFLSFWNRITPPMMWRYILPILSFGFLIAPVLEIVLSVGLQKRDGYRKQQNQAPDQDG